MRVLQINTVFGKGSTGTIVKEIEYLLERSGHESYIAFARGDSDNSHHYHIGNEIDHKIHSFLFSRILGIQGLGSRYYTYKLTKWIAQIKPDVIQIHTLHAHFINIKVLFSFLNRSKIPVVWSFFDCWPFTGKCTHFTEVNCYKWKTGCNNCPHLHLGAKTYFFDRTKKMYEIKKAYCSSLDKLDIIVCSNWLKKIVEYSIYKNHPIHMIYNWIDTTKFKQIQDYTIITKYGIPTDKKVIVSVSAFWGKINTRLTDALRLAKILPEGFQMVLVGNMDSGISLPENVLHINYVEGTRDLSVIYSSALAYVNFSVEDTFGKVIAEAMLCGTPAIVFNATACPEVVGDVGYVVDPHNVDDMFEKIKVIAANGRDYYSERCISHVKKNYDFTTNVSKYLDIYTSKVKQ